MADQNIEDPPSVETEITTPYHKTASGDVFSGLENVDDDDKSIPTRQFRTHRQSKLMMELIGTAMWVFTLQISTGGKEDGNGRAVYSSASTLAPLATGGVLVALIFAGGPISGGHYNPAVSFSVALRGIMNYREMLRYWGAQFVGAIVGGLFGALVAPSKDDDGAFFTPVVEVGEGSNLLKALLAEEVFTFFLCFVVLCVGTNARVDDNQYYGLAIGLVVMAGGILIGPISGGALNPSVALMLSIGGGWQNFVYGIFVGLSNLLGGAAAAGCFYVVVPNEF